MHVEMKYSLSGGLTVVLYDVKAVTAQSLSHDPCHFLCQNYGFCGQFLRNLINIGIMSLRQDQGMSPGCRTQIQDHPEIIILVQCCAVPDAIGKITEYTIFHFFSPLQGKIYFSYTRKMCEYVELCRTNMIAFLTPNGVHLDKNDKSIPQEAPYADTQRL